MRENERRAAEAVTVIAWRNFGVSAFRVDLRGKHWNPLKDAEKLGLAWWPGRDRCALTARGAELATQYQPEDLD